MSMVTALCSKTAILKEVECVFTFVHSHTAGPGKPGLLNQPLNSLNFIKRSPDNSEPKTWIDLIFVDNSDIVCDHHNKTPPFHSSHNLIDVKIKLFVPKTPKESFTFRKFKNITPEVISEVLAASDWTSFHQTHTDTDLMLNCLNKNMQAAIDLLAPEKTIIPKKSKQPWTDSEYLINPLIRIVIETT